MDFAPEPVLDAFTPPPTRAAPRAQAADDKTFDDHLSAVSEPLPERATQAPDEARPEATPIEADDTETSDDRFDPDTALLGGPLPAPAPPPMAAPVIVQIATSAQQETLLPDAEPITAPQALSPAEPALQAEAAAPASGTPTEDKPAEAEAKSAADEAQAPPIQTPLQAQATPRQQQTLAAPIETQSLPPEAQQAIAQTIAPARQATQPSEPRNITKDAAKSTDTAPGEHESKADTASATKGAKSPAPKALANGDAVTDTSAPMAQTGGSAPDASAQSSAVTTTASQASTHVQHAALDSGAQRAAPAAAQVSREIIRRFNGGSTNFELRLDPPELGRVEVRMEVTRDNRVTAVIAADNPQALTELMRHARDLEQQLQSAGLQLSDNGLSFDLRQGAQGGESDSEAASASKSAEEAANEQPQQPLARPAGIDRWRGVRIDMMV